MSNLYCAYRYHKKKLKNCILILTNSLLVRSFLLLGIFLRFRKFVHQSILGKFSCKNGTVSYFQDFDHYNMRFRYYVGLPEWLVWGTVPVTLGNVKSFWHMWRHNPYLRNPRLIIFPLYPLLPVCYSSNTGSDVGDSELFWWRFPGFVILDCLLEYIAVLEWCFL